MIYTRAVASWLPLALAITGLCLLTYFAGQQSFRSSLNDPQIQIAEDAADALSNGVSPAQIVPREPLINANKSLRTFIAIYDQNGTPLEASATINGKPPRPPSGVFENAAWWSHGHTWQPSPDVRIATVIIPYTFGNTKGYVLAGRNMREIESRIIDFGFKVLVAWGVIILSTLVLQLMITFLKLR